MAVMRRIRCLLMLALCLTSLSACVIAPAPVYGRGWVAGHYHGWHWVPGHWA